MSIERILMGLLAIVVIECLMFAWLEVHQQNTAAQIAAEVEARYSPGTQAGIYTIAEVNDQAEREALERAMEIKGCYWYDAVKRRYVVAAQKDCGGAL